MIYNFSNLFKDNTEIILEEFLDKYTTYINNDNDTGMSVLSNHYRKILSAFNSNFEKEYILKLFEELAKYEISLEIPYVMITNEIFCLKNVSLNEIVCENKNFDILQLLSLFTEINNMVANVYLLEYANKLISLNNIRITSISDLLEKNIIQHYEAHLIWLSKLARSIKDKSLDNFPEKEEKMCSFGKWLHDDGKKIIQNNSKYKTISTLHNNLHLFGQKIFTHIDNSDHHILITYLEKCELISLSIGTELALIDNILMNKKVTKDSLTGSLNRHGLETVFESQYELSLATNNHFVLAICDLDHFKNINDTYGHIAGDKVLKLFVKIVKNNIRNSDVIIRYGGEEFVLMLPAINKAKGLDVLEKIRQDFQESILEFENNKISATVSMGMMEIKPKHYYKHGFLDDYIMMVDQRLYIAKNSGRNKIEAF